MRSNVCKIEKGTRDLAAIFEESERVAEYNRLTHKQALHLRLLCEEIDGVLPRIIDDFYGELWIDFEDGECRVNLSVEIPEFNIEKKEELIAIAKVLNISVDELIGVEETYVTSRPATPTFRFATVHPYSSSMEPDSYDNLIELSETEADLLLKFRESSEEKQKAILAILEQE